MIQWLVFESREAIYCNTTIISRGNEAVPSGCAQNEVVAGYT
jgi:hypothetical protein